MSSNNIYTSDLNKLHGLVQSSMIVYPKEMIIAHLRDYFSNDSYYHYVKDQWGFPNTPDHTDLPLGAGTTDSTTTRIYIGENYRHDGIFYPCLLVKLNSMRYVPISINRERGKYETEDRIYEDGYGNQLIYKNPTKFLFEGIFEGSMSIDVMTRSLRSRDDLIELVLMYLVDIGFESLERSGIVIKPPSTSGPSERDDRNDKIYTQSISFDIRTEWKREIPIKNIVESILFSIEFANLQNDPPIVAQNLTISTEYSLTDLLSKF